MRIRGGRNIRVAADIIRDTRREGRTFVDSISDLRGVLDIDKTPSNTAISSGVVGSD